jgi:5-hydroxyisourate hydrolase
MKLSTHVLDLASGRPAAAVAVRLHRHMQGSWHGIAAHQTDENGRVADLLLDKEELQRGFYRLRFGARAYFRAKGVESLHPFIDIVFEVRNPKEHHHIPLLITPHSYSTYRGS